MECFIFALLAEMQEKEVQLYAIKQGGELQQYSRVIFNGKEDLPSQGVLANPNDKALVEDIEDQIIDAHGHAIVEIKCRKARRGEWVDLGAKMLRPQHVVSLMAAVNKYRVTKLHLGFNQLGPEGGAKPAEALQTNTTLKLLECALAALSTDAQRSLLCGRAPG